MNNEYIHENFIFSITKVEISVKESLIRKIRSLIWPLLLIVHQTLCMKVKGLIFMDKVDTKRIAEEYKINI